MPDQPAVTRTRFEWDGGRAERAMAEEVYRYRASHYTNSPAFLIVGVDLYEPNAVSGSAIAFNNSGHFGMAFPDRFMGIPLIVVPDRGFCRAVGENKDTLLQFGGKPEEGTPKKGDGTP